MGDAPRCNLLRINSELHLQFPSKEHCILWALWQQICHDKVILLRIHQNCWQVETPPCCFQDVFKRFLLFSGHVYLRRQSYKFTIQTFRWQDKILIGRWFGHSFLYLCSWTSNLYKQRQNIMSIESVYRLNPEILWLHILRMTSFAHYHTEGFWKYTSLEMLIFAQQRVQS